MRQDQQDLSSIGWKGNLNIFNPSGHTRAAHDAAVAANSGKRHRQGKVQRSPMLAVEALAANVGGSVIATVMTAVAAGIALVAGAFAIYDTVVAVTSQAIAAGLTALALALVSVITGLIGPRIVRARAAAAERRLGPRRSVENSALVGMAAEFALIVAGLAADRALRHRAKR
jgi:hypothetical protein